MSGTPFGRPSTVQCVDVVQDFVGFGDAREQTVDRFRRNAVEGSIVMTHGVVPDRRVAPVDTMSRIVPRIVRPTE